MNTTFSIEYDLRPCVVRDINALFHRWVEMDGVDVPAVRRRYDGAKACKVYALVEYKNGVVSCVPPHTVRFLDNKHDEYCFEVKK